MLLEVTVKIGRCSFQMSGATLLFQHLLVVIQQLSAAAFQGTFIHTLISLCIDLFVFICVYFVCFCFILCIIVSMVGGSDGIEA